MTSILEIELDNTNYIGLLFVNGSLYFRSFVPASLLAAFCYFLYTPKGGKHE